MKSVLFVCLGNICRSPAAECLLRKKAQERGIENLIVASCGLSAWQVGKPADFRMREEALKRGLLIETKAKLFVSPFFDDFDWILAVDEEVMDSLSRYAANERQRKKLQLITCFSKRYPNLPIPDPYHGGKEGFAEVMNMLEDACDGLLDQLKI